MASIYDFQLKRRKNTIKVEIFYRGLYKKKGTFNKVPEKLNNITLLLFQRLESAMDSISYKY